MPVPQLPAAGKMRIVVADQQPTAIDPNGRRLPLGIVLGTASEAVAKVAATGTVTFSDVPSADDTITVGTVTITVVSADPGEAEMLPGADATAAAANLAAAIVAANPMVDAIAVDEVVTITSTTASGAAGNSVALAKDGDNIAVSGANLSGGVDAVAQSPGAPGSIMVDNDNLYVRTASGTWKGVALSDLGDL